MKLSFKQIEPFVQNPDPKIGIILLYGPNAGLIKERAKIIGLKIVDNLDDPFNVISLNASDITEDPARLSDEAGAISMMGGRRLIRISEATDSLTSILKDYAENPNLESVVILEAGELAPKSSLRKLAEQSPNIAPIPCYNDDEQGISNIIRQTLHHNGQKIDQDAVLWLAQNLDNDRMLVLSELQKIITFKGPDPSPISLEDVIHLCSSDGAENLERLIQGCASQNVLQVVSAYQSLIDEGTSFVLILRALSNYFARIEQVKGFMNDGKSFDEASKTLSPPLFFKQKNSFASQVRQWDQTSLRKVQRKLYDVEGQCKTTGIPVESFCGQSLIGICKLRLQR